MLTEATSLPTRALISAAFSGTNLAEDGNLYAAGAELGQHVAKATNIFCQGLLLLFGAVVELGQRVLDSASASCTWSSLEEDKGVMESVICVGKEGTRIFANRRY